MTSEGDGNKNELCMSAYSAVAKDAHISHFNFNFVLISPPFAAAFLSLAVNAKQIE